MASEPLLRILNGNRSQDGSFHLQIAASNTLAYVVQTSTNLLEWIPLQTNLFTGNLAEFVDTNTKSFRLRYYRLTEHKNGLLLSKSNANPGDKLVITGGPFDPAARTLVRFLDATGSEVAVRAFTVTTGSVAVAVPFMVNTSAPQIRGGLVKVSLGQVTAAATNVFASAQPLQIADLSVTGLAPGAVTLEYLKQISNLLATALSRWQTIGNASQGKVDAATLRRDLLSMQTNVVAAQKMIQRIVSGQTSRISLGRIHDREVILDMDAVVSLDRMLVASLNYRSATSLLAKSSISRLDTADIMSRIGETFSPGQSSQSTFDMFDQFNSIGGLGVGILATTAVVLGVATAPAAAAVAGTAGAVLFFSTYVAPAVMGASAMALAAPFIEVQTGHQITLEDYRPALNHIEKGSQAYLYDELQGNVLNGVFKSQGASEDLIAQSSLFVSTSKSVLDNLDLTKPQSVGSLAFANSATIFAGLRPANDLSFRITSAVCSLESVVGFAGIVDYTYKIVASGIATGPVSSWMHVSAWVEEDQTGYTPDIISVPSWSHEEGYVSFFRGAGQPAETSWTASWEFVTTVFFGPPPPPTPYVIEGSVAITLPGGLSMAEDSAPVSCQ